MLGRHLSTAIGP